MIRFSSLFDADVIGAITNKHIFVCAWVRVMDRRHPSFSNQIQKNEYQRYSFIYST